MSAALNTPAKRRARVNVRFFPADVAAAHFAPGCRHQLHHPDGTDRAPPVLVEPRFLAAAGGQYQRTEFVARLISERRIRPGRNA
jgi:hypothetical protein